MFLSELSNKPIYVKNTVKGVCIGVGISLKSYAVKYLICQSNADYHPRLPRADFFLSVSAIQSVSPSAIRVSALRTIRPKNCAQIFIGMPIFAENGANLGIVQDLQIKDFITDKLFNAANDAFPCTSITAALDAVILRKEQPYPIGQRIHTPIVREYFNHTNHIVTKATLKNALQKRAIIKLTLSLPPFNQELSFKND